MTGSLLLRGGVLADGTPTTITIDTDTGLIERVEHVIQPGDERQIAAFDDAGARMQSEVLDCSGMVILNTAVEPHAHLDKVLSAAGQAALPDTLEAAIGEWTAASQRISHDDTVRRATSAVESMVARGTTIIRSHVDVSHAVGVRAVRAIAEVRDAMAQRGLADIEIVALAAPPMLDSAGAQHRDLLREALASGADIVGGAPHLDSDPIAATTVAAMIAAEAGVGIDLHTDETVDPAMMTLQHFARLVGDLGIRNAVASHCISLSTQSIERQQAIAADVAAASLAVTTMPLTSLFYFGWDQAVCPPRGLTAINTLEEAGVVVAAGADNVRDHFFPFGRFDPFETAAVLSMAAHIDPAHAWEMCTARGRAALGRPAATIDRGQVADLLLIRGRNLGEAIAAASEHRIVLRRGRIIARTDVHHTTTPSSPPSTTPSNQQEQAT